MKMLLPKYKLKQKNVSKLMIQATAAAETEQHQLKLPRLKLVLP